MPFEVVHCRRVGGGDRPPDRDVKEGFKKPASEFFTEICERLREDGHLSKAEFHFLIRRRCELVAFDRRLYTHCCAVAIIAYSLARENNESIRTQVKALIYGFVHDIGKMKVDKRILWAPCSEWRENRASYRQAVSKHVWAGYRRLRRLRGLANMAECALVALLHHRDQEHHYPSQEELTLHEVPMDCLTDEVKRIIDYIVAGDISEASRRVDDDETCTDLQQLDAVEERERSILALKERRPDLSGHIDLIFRGIIS